MLRPTSTTLITRRVFGYVFGAWHPTRRATKSLLKGCPREMSHRRQIMQARSLVDLCQKCLHHSIVLYYFQRGLSLSVCVWLLLLCGDVLRVTNLIVVPTTPSFVSWASHKSWTIQCKSAIHHYFIHSNIPPMINDRRRETQNQPPVVILFCTVRSCRNAAR